jgi:hypothetical protein
LNVLYSAHQSDDEAYSLAERRISGECREMKEEISTLPPGVLRVLSPRLATEFAKLLSRRQFKAASTVYKFWSEGRYVSACKVVFRCVLNRYIQRFEDHNRSDWFAQTIIIKNLDSVPGLVELSIKPSFIERQPSLLTTMIHHLTNLTNLQMFECPAYCTDEIVLKLRLHCPKLTHADFEHSKQVTNSSVEHLMELKKLKFLNLKQTKIDDEHYGLLLSNLPQIANVSFLKVGDAILANITAEQLDTITHISGSFQNIHDLTQKFPNTTNISLYCNYSRMTGLTGFRALRVLEFFDLFYGPSAVSAVLHDVGHRLTDLKLCMVTDLNLHEIVTLCPSLKNLSMVSCSESDSNHNTPFDTQLPHFRNVINLKIKHYVARTIASRFIRNYINVKTIYFKEFCVFTGEFVTDIIKLGTLTQLEVLHVEECWPGALTMEVLELLIQHCPLLNRIEGLRKCPRINRLHIRNLKAKLSKQNIDLLIQR